MIHFQLCEESDLDYYIVLKDSARARPDVSQRQEMSQPPLDVTMGSRKGTHGLRSHYWICTARHQNRLTALTGLATCMNDI